MNTLFASITKSFLIAGFDDNIYNKGRLFSFSYNISLFNIVQHFFFHVEFHKVMLPTENIFKTNTILVCAYPSVCYACNVYQKSDTLSVSNKINAFFADIYFQFIPFNIPITADEIKTVFIKTFVNITS